MSNVTMQRLKSCVRIGAAAVVTMVGMFGMTLDPTVAETIGYIGVTFLVGGYAAWKDNNLTKGRIAAQDFVDIAMSDFQVNRRDMDDAMVADDDDAEEEVLDEEPEAIEEAK